MKQFSPLWLLCSVPLIVGLASCRQAAPSLPASGIAASHPAPQQPAWTGFRVTSAQRVEVKPDSIEKLVNLEQWTFEVDMDNDHTPLWQLVEQQYKGQRRALAVVADPPEPQIPHSTHRRITIGAYPLGSSWTDSRKIRVIQTEANNTGFNATASERYNPFVDAKAVAITRPILQRDGTFALMWGTKQFGGPIYPVPVDDDIVLTMRFAAGAKPKWTAQMSATKPGTGASETGSPRH